MPPASHRLDLYLLSTQTDDCRFPSALHSLGLEQGWWAEDGTGGPGLIEGGFVSARLEEHDGVRMIANQQGGFRVRCPACSEPLARPFGQAVAQWRAGGERVVLCPSCGEVSALEAVDTRPPVGFARGWVHLRDVERAVLLGAADAAVRAAVGAYRIVGRRPS